jgi:hypothetical protein
VNVDLVQAAIHCLQFDVRSGQLPKYCYVISAADREAHIGRMERNILFKCPRTGMNVQHWLAGASSQSVDTHVSVPCPACGSLHIVNTCTGKLLNAQGDRAESTNRNSKGRQSPT